MKTIHYLTQDIFNYSIERMAVTIYNTSDSYYSCYINKVSIRATKLCGGGDFLNFIFSTTRN